MMRESACSSAIEWGSLASPETIHQCAGAGVNTGTNKTLNRIAITCSLILILTALALGYFYWKQRWAASAGATDGKGTSVSRGLASSDVPGMS